LLASWFYNNFSTHGPCSMMMDLITQLTSLDYYTTISIVNSAMYRHKISSYGRESQCCSQSQSSPCTKTDRATICSEL